MNKIFERGGARRGDCIILSGVVPGPSLERYDFSTTPTSTTMSKEMEDGDKDGEIRSDDRDGGNEASV